MVIPGLRALLLKDIEQVDESFPLSTLNTLGTGGEADYYTIATDAISLATAVKTAIDHELPYTVVGEAKSVLFSDDGFDGMVIHNKARGSVLANDRSQIVVESGLPLKQFITFAAGRGFAGLTEFYGDTGTVGGALYANTTEGGRSIFSALRYLTLIMPPTKIKADASVVRYRVDWMTRSPEETKLQWMKSTNPTAPQPIILNAQFQLTSVRPDEIVRRITQEAQLIEKNIPTGAVFGPVFAAVPGVDVEELLTGSGVSSLKIGSLYPDRYHPNYLRSGRGQATSAQILELTQAMAAKVKAQYAVDLVMRYELVGAW